MPWLLLLLMCAAANRLRHAEQQVKQSCAIAQAVAEPEDQVAHMRTAYCLIGQYSRLPLHFVVSEACVQAAAHKGQPLCIVVKPWQHFISQHIALYAEVLQRPPVRAPCLAVDRPREKQAYAHQHTQAGISSQKAAALLVLLARQPLPLPRLQDRTCMQRGACRVGTQC